MSGEPKTLWEMTPREAWEHAWEQAIDTCRVFEEEATAGRLEVVRSIGRQYLDQDAGVPVVARDEAAELRAENERLRGALREIAYSRARPRYASRACRDLSDIADVALRRLAGAEEQE